MDLFIHYYLESQTGRLFGAVASVAVAGRGVSGQGDPPRATDGAVDGGSEAGVCVCVYECAGIWVCVCGGAACGCVCVLASTGLEG